MKLGKLSSRDRFDVLLEKRLSGVAELRYTMLYGKSQRIYLIQDKICPTKHREWAIEYR